MYLHNVFIGKIIYLIVKNINDVNTYFFSCINFVILRQNWHFFCQQCREKYLQKRHL
jgi:hypothetical protein